MSLIITFAGGCTRSVARTDATVTNNLVRIRPVDQASGGDTCSTDLIFLRHTEKARIDVSGPALIRTSGDQRGSAAGAVNQPAELTRELIVR